MSKFIAAARTFVAAEEGASLVEYGLLVGLIAVVCITAITALGTNIMAVFQASSSALTTAKGNMTPGGGS